MKGPVPVVLREIDMMMQLRRQVIGHQVLPAFQADSKPLHQTFALIYLCDSANVLCVIRLLSTCLGSLKPAQQACNLLIMNGMYYGWRNYCISLAAFADCAVWSVLMWLGINMSVM